MSRKAIIDVGSNSIKLLVAEPAADGTIRTILEDSDIARLGEGLRETGMISPEAMARNSKVIARFAKKANESGADEMVCVGTMALRNAKNTNEFVNLVKKTCNVNLTVIPGEEEARLSYLAVLSGLPLPQFQEGRNEASDGSKLERSRAKLAIFDTGGGSTEFIFGDGNTVNRRFSVDLGAIRITEKHFQSDPVSQADVNAAIAEIDSIFEENAVTGQLDQLVGMGGTVTSMGAVKHKMAKYNPDVIQGSKLTMADVEAQIAEYSSRSIEERKEITGLQPKRADVILAGACILKVIISRLGVDKLIISDRGLRHGLAFDMLAKNNS
ncbi:MAG: Ppx/GppA family phosphatase [Defluviitaleaceae bacterium]|nr:Ppx/GppA family phosphatase [Defluviitaleaceae bacterium]